MYFILPNRLAYSFCKISNNVSASNSDFNNLSYFSLRLVFLNLNVPNVFKDPAFSFVVFPCCILSLLYSILFLCFGFTLFFSSFLKCKNRLLI